jgi:DNA polymerase-3 subunit alpha
MAAVLSADMDHTDKIVTLIDECAHIGLTVLPPDINSSSYMFAVADERTIRYGLGAIKGVGRSAVEAIVGERDRHGPYLSLVDVCRRIDLSRLSRRVFEALIRCGSLDGLGPNRATLMANLEQAMAASEQSARSREAGQVDFFGSSALAAAAAALTLKPVAEWSASQRLAGERETLGLYLTGHPIAPYEHDLRYFASGRIADFASERPSAPVDPARSYMDARSVTLAGLIVEIRRRGPRVSFMLDDRSGRMEVTMFEEVYQRHRELVVKDALVQVEGALRFDEFSDAWRLAARQLQSLDTVRERLARHLLITWPHVANGHALVSQLEGLLRQARDGQCSVLLRYRGHQADGTLSFGEDWKVRPSRALLEQLEHLLGSGAARLSYGLEALSASTAVAT